MTRALLEQALAALEGVLDAPVGAATQFWSCSGGVYEAVECNNAINALQAELAKPNTQLVQPECWCTRCDLEVNTFRSHMAICPLCGDKWCPRAKDHRNECTKKSTYDQTALELCETCGWKTLIPGEGCLNCERKTVQAATLAERERCAKVCEAVVRRQSYGHAKAAAGDCADFIRSGE